MKTTFLELVDGVGIEPSHIADPTTGEAVPNPNAGQPGPLCPVGINIPFPTMVGSELVEDTRAVEIPVSNEPLSGDWAAAEVRDGALQSARVIPGTRMVETNAPPVVDVLLSTGNFRVCDAPKSALQVRHASQSKAAIQETARALGVDVKSQSKAKLIEEISEAEAAQENPEPTEPAPAGTETTEEV